MNDLLNQLRDKSMPEKIKQTLGGKYGALDETKFMAALDGNQAATEEFLKENDATISVRNSLRSYGKSPEKRMGILASIFMLKGKKAKKEIRDDYEFNQKTMLRMEAYVFFSNKTDSTEEDLKFFDEIKEVLSQVGYFKNEIRVRDEHIGGEPDRIRAEVEEAVKATTKDAAGQALAVGGIAYDLGEQHGRDDEGKKVSEELGQKIETLDGKLQELKVQLDEAEEDKAELEKNLQISEQEKQKLHDKLGQRLKTLREAIQRTQDQLEEQKRQKEAAEKNAKLANERGDTAEEKIQRIVERARAAFERRKEKIAQLKTDLEEIERQKAELENNLQGSEQEKENLRKRIGEELEPELQKIKDRITEVERDRDLARRRAEDAEGQLAGESERTKAAVEGAQKIGEEMGRKEGKKVFLPVLEGKSEEIVDLKSAMQKLENDLEREREAKREAIRGAAVVVESLTAKIAEREKALDSLKKSTDANDSQKTAEIGKITAELAELRGKMGAEAQKKNDLEASIKKLEIEAGARGEELRQVQWVLKQTQKRLEMAEGEIVERREGVAALQRANQKLQGKLAGEADRMKIVTTSAYAEGKAAGAKEKGDAAKAAGYEEGIAKGKADVQRLETAIGERDERIVILTRDKEAAESYRQKIAGELQKAVKERDAASTNSQKLEAERIALSKNLESERARATNAESELATARQKTGDLERQLDGKQRELGDLNKQHGADLEKEKGKTGQEKARAQRLETEIRKLRSDIEEQRTAIRSAVIGRDRANAGVASLEAAAKNLNITIRKLESEIESQKRKIAALLQEKQKLETAVQDLEAEGRRKDGEVKTAQKDLAEAKGIIEGKNKTIATLQGEKDTLSAQLKGVGKELRERETAAYAKGKKAGMAEAESKGAKRYGEGYERGVADADARQAQLEAQLRAMIAKDAVDIAGLRKNLADTKAEKNEVTGELKRRNDAFKAQQKEVESLRDKNGELSTELGELSTELGEQRQRRVTAEQERNRLRFDNAILRRDLEKLPDLLEKAAALKEAIPLISRLEQEIRELKKEIAALQGGQKPPEPPRPPTGPGIPPPLPDSFWQGESARLQQLLAAKEAELEKANRTITETVGQVVGLAVENNDITRESNALRSERDTLRSEKDHAKEAEAWAHAIVEKMGNNEQDLKERLELFQAQITEWQKIAGEFEHEWSQAQQELTHAQAEKRQLEEDIASGRRDAKGLGIVNRKIKGLTRRLRTLEGKKAELEAENKRLKKETGDLERKVRAAGLEKDAAVQSADAERKLTKAAVHGERHANKRLAGEQLANETLQERMAQLEKQTSVILAEAKRGSSTEWKKAANTLLRTMAASYAQIESARAELKSAKKGNEDKDVEIRDLGRRVVNAEREIRVMEEGHGRMKSDLMGTKGDLRRLTREQNKTMLRLTGEKEQREEDLRMAHGHLQKLQEKLEEALQKNFRRDVKEKLRAKMATAGITASDDRIDAAIKIALDPIKEAAFKEHIDFESEEDADKVAQHILVNILMK